MSIGLNGVNGLTSANNADEIEKLKNAAADKTALSTTQGASYKAAGTTNEDDLVSFVEEDENQAASLVNNQDPELEEDGIKIIIELPPVDDPKDKGKDKTPPPPPPEDPKHPKKPDKKVPPPKPPKTKPNDKDKNKEPERTRIVISLDEEVSNLKDTDTLKEA